MIDFRTPALADRQWMTDLLERSDTCGSLSSFGAMYIWADSFDVKVYRSEDSLLVSEDDNGCYFFPVGDVDISKTIPLLRDDAHERGKPFCMIGVELPQVEALVKAFPSQFEIAERRDIADYVYLSEQLANLPGKKYQSKRNHVSRFCRTYKDWCYEDITADNKPECAEMASRWFAERGINPSNESESDKHALEIALHDMEQLGFYGGLIRVGGQVVSMTLGERLCDNCFIVHFEKALEAFSTAYAVINQEFAKRLCGSYKYINREEDMGIEGLRKAKMSYHPDFLIRKFTITER